MSTSVAPGICRMMPRTWVPISSSFSRSRPTTLTEFAPFTPERPSSMLSWMYWEKLKLTPLNSAAKRSCSSPMIPSFVIPFGHSSWLEGHEEFGVVEAGGIASVVRASVLRDHGDHFRTLPEDPPHAADVRHPGLKRDRLRHGGSNPQVSLLEGREELAPEPRGQEPGGDQEGHPDRDDERPAAERPA